MTGLLFNTIKKIVIVLPFTALSIPLSSQALFSQGITAYSKQDKIDTLFVDAGGFKLFMVKKGNAKGYTVLMEDGMCGSGLRWNSLDDSIALDHTVITYSRAFIGKSGKGNPDRQPANVVSELKTALNNAGIPGPYILIGYSLGGHYTKAFARAFPNEVKGILLIDPLNSVAFYTDYKQNFPELYRLETSALNETEKDHPCYNEIQFGINESAHGDGSVPEHIPTYMLISSLASELEIHPDQQREDGQLNQQDKWDKNNKAAQESWVRHHMKWASGFPNVTTEVTNECTHAMHHERPDIVWNAFLKLMDDISNQNLLP